MAQKDNKNDLRRLESIVEKTLQHDNKNNKAYHDYRSFIYKSTSSSNFLHKGNSNFEHLSFNGLEAYVSRLRGEYSKQNPSIILSKSQNTDISTEQLDFIQDYIRTVLDEANRECGFQDIDYDRRLTGGWNVAKVYTDYEEMSFYQNIKVKNVQCPTMCGFDPSAIDPCKSDGRYCFELYTLTLEELNSLGYKIKETDVVNQYNAQNFKWQFQKDEEKYIVVCDLYTKRKEKITIVQLPDGSSMLKDDYDEIVNNWSDQFSLPPEIIATRYDYKNIIELTRFTKGYIFEKIDTDFRFFPLVYIDGNSEKIGKADDLTFEEIRRPYFYQAIGQQILKEIANRKLASHIDNLSSLKWKVSMQAIPKENPMLLDAYKNDKAPSNVLLYNELDERGNRLTPPVEVAQMGVPPEIINTISYSEQAIQFALGSFDSSLGINDNQLSGTAIQEGATQSNATAMPYITAGLKGLTRIAEIIIDLIPKYINHGRAINVIDKENKQRTVGVNDFGNKAISTNFDPRKIKVNIEAGVSFSVQMSKTANILKENAVASPVFAQFLYSEQGLPILFDNLDFKDKDKVKDAMESYFEQMKQSQQNQPNIPLMREETNARRLDVEEQKIKAETAIKMAGLALDNRKAESEENRVKIQSGLSISKQDLERDRLEIEKSNHQLNVASEVLRLNHEHKIDKAKHELEKEKSKKSNEKTV